MTTSCGHTAILFQAGAFRLTGIEPYGPLASGVACGSLELDVHVQRPVGDVAVFFDAFPP